MNARSAFALILTLAPVLDALADTTNYSSVKQGFSMRVQMMNIGAFGRVGFPPFGGSPPADSIGVEFPVGSPIEHVYGGGLWVGGLLDTSQGGGGQPLRRVSLAYEGWSGPHFEFHPGDQPADTIWQVIGQGAPRPPGWDAYWGTSLPYTPIADQNFFCTYTDTAVAVSGHVPLRLKVIQSSYAWDIPEPLMILEYRIINHGWRTIDSAYAGMFVDADVGPITTPNYFQSNYSAYLSLIQTAYVNNPVHTGSTPIGARFLHASEPYQRFTFDWYPGPNTPSNDTFRYSVMSSGTIRPDEYPNLSDTRFNLSVGPFSLRPVTDPSPDTLLIAFALVSGNNVAELQQSAVVADSLYRALLTSIEEPRATPVAFALHQNYPNPFNPSTTINYSLPSQAPNDGKGRVGVGYMTTVKVYDVLGRMVASLVHESTM